MLARRLAVLVMAVVLLLGPAVPALAADPGTASIVGQVVNGSQDNKPLAGQDVVMRTYDGQSEISSATVKTDPNGQFAFTGLANQPNLNYQAEVAYKDIQYYSDVVTFAAVDTVKAVNVPVYETSDTGEGIKIDVAHAVIAVSQGVLHVDEYYIVSNTSTLTYVGSKPVSGGKKETARFPVPADAVQTQYLLGITQADAFVTEGGFIGTVPLRPGQTQIAYSYVLPKVSGEYTFVRKALLPTARLEVLIQGDGVKAVSSQLQSQAPVQMGTLNLSRYSGGGIAAGDTITFKITGLPTKTNWTYAWAGVGAVMIVGAVLLLLLRRRRQPDPAAAVVGVAQRKETLLMELAQLDSDFEAGSLPKDIYEGVRAEKKAELIELIRQSREERR